MPQPSKKPFFIAGTVALWITTMVLQPGKHEGPDRANAVQVASTLMVLGAPALAYGLRRRPRWVRALLLGVQLGLYVLYERGISIETIRVDVVLIYPAILFTAWIAVRPDNTCEVRDDDKSNQGEEKQRL